MEEPAIRRRRGETVLLCHGGSSLTEIRIYVGRKSKMILPAFGLSGLNGLCARVCVTPPKSRRGPLERLRVKEPAQRT